MNSKFVVPVLALLICALVSEGVNLSRMGNELRNQCASTHSRFIPPRNIRDIKLIQSTPHHQNTEVIATLKDGREVCLDPTASWVKIIITAILDKAQAKDKKKL